jgi:hypothetical protein
MASGLPGQTNCVAERIASLLEDQMETVSSEAEKLLYVLCAEFLKLYQTITPSERRMPTAFDFWVDVAAMAGHLRMECPIQIEPWPAI